MDKIVFNNTNIGLIWGMMSDNNLSSLFWGDLGETVYSYDTVVSMELS